MAVLECEVGLYLHSPKCYYLISLHYFFNLKYLWIQYKYYSSTKYFWISCWKSIMWRTVGWFESAVSWYSFNLSYGSFLPSVLVVILKRKSQSLLPQKVSCWLVNLGRFRRLVGSCWDALTQVGVCYHETSSSMLCKYTIKVYCHSTLHNPNVKLYWRTPGTLFSFGI
jgi:hypothetical protein